LTVVEKRNPSPELGIRAIANGKCGSSRCVCRLGEGEEDGWTGDPGGRPEGIMRLIRAALNFTGALVRRKWAT
jgi:hypothetical protein